MTRFQLTLFWFTISKSLISNVRNQRPILLFEPIGAFAYGHYVNREHQSLDTRLSEQFISGARAYPPVA
jgi:hypothetical protein